MCARMGEKEGDQKKKMRAEFSSTKTQTVGKVVKQKEI